jgi:serine/threonine-protein kinase
VEPAAPATTPRPPSPDDDASSSSDVSSSASPYAPGTKIGGYVVQRAIARGGMGQVLLAVDERLEKRVALKVLPRADADDEARARFLREARALARVEHAGVVRVLASGDDDGVAWMALDYIEGDSLTALSAGEPMDEETAVALMAQVARGLAAVHAEGVVHRDVKPDNLLVDDDANVKIVDFGVAWFADGGGGFTTRAGVVVGTPHFMSPEQARGGAVDARSDAWSLGATLWMLLCGRPPFARGDDEADLDILARVVRDPLPDLATLAPATSAATRALLSSLLDKDASARPADLGAVAQTLDEIAAALARGEAPSSPSSSVSLTGVSPATASAATDAASTAVTGAVPVRDGASLSAVAGVVGVVVLVVAGVAGGVAFGRQSAPPTVQERVVERVVKVPVPVEVPVTAPPVSPSLPPLVDASPPKPKPTAEELAHALSATAKGGLPAAVDDVVAQNDAASRAALVLVAGTAGPAGDVVVQRALFDERVDRSALLQAALRAADRSRALVVVQQLQNRRDDAAFATLREIAETHADPRVRRAAALARDSIFSASEETPQ